MEKEVDLKHVIKLIKESQGDGLEDENDIEDLMAAIYCIDEKIDATKEQKRSLSKKLNNQIEKLEVQKDTIKDVIGKTLSKCDDDSGLQKPGVGKVSLKSGKTSYVVKDEKALKTWVKDNHPKVYKKVFEIKESMSKRNLNSLLKELTSLPDCVEKDEGEEQVTVYFNDKFKAKFK